MKKKLKKELNCEIEHSLANNFLRQSMDNFAMAYHEAEEKAFINIDKNGLITQVSQIKTESVSRMNALYEEFKREARESKYTILESIYKKKDDALKVIITEDIVSKMFDIIAIAEDFSDYLRGLIIKYPSK